MREENSKHRRLKGGVVILMAPVQYQSCKPEYLKGKDRQKYSYEKRRKMSAREVGREGPKGNRTDTGALVMGNVS